MSSPSISGPPRTATKCFSCEKTLKDRHVQALTGGKAHPFCGSCFLSRDNPDGKMLQGMKKRKIAKQIPIAKVRAALHEHASQCKSTRDTMHSKYVGTCEVHVCDGSYKDLDEARAKCLTAEEALECFLQLHGTVPEEDEE